MCTNQNKRARSVAGYILVEAVTALVVLAIGAFAIQASMRQAVIARGQAEDYTHARFLLDELMSDIERRELVRLEEDAGTFDAPYERFDWAYSIRRVNLPTPRTGGVESYNSNFKYLQNHDFLLHVQVTLTWQRAGIEHSESLETLLPPRKLFRPGGKD